jgi:hypothetical protein
MLCHFRLHHDPTKHPLKSVTANDSFALVKRSSFFFQIEIEQSTFKWNPTAVFSVHAGRKEL